MKSKNLFAITTLIFLQIVSIALVASEKQEQLGFFVNQKARANAFPYKPFPQIPFNNHQGIQEPNSLSFNYSKLDLERLNDVIHINPNAQDAEGITPLYWACCNNNLEVIQSLLNNTQTKPNKIINGRTALHIACEWGNIEMVKLLLNNDKTDLNKKTSWGCTALDIAHNKNNAEIIQLLLAHPNIQENNVSPDSNGDETIDVFEQRNREIIRQLAAKNVQQNWLYSTLHSLRKTISRNKKALYQTCCNNRSETTQPLNEQKTYHNTALDNERSNALSKYILRFIVYPNLALVGIVMTGCIVFVKYVR